jgi:hypothetical protein
LCEATSVAEPESRAEDPKLNCLLKPDPFYLIKT